MGDLVEIQTLDGSDRFPAYRATPGGTPKAAILAIQEIFGLNPGIRAKVDDWAAQGYLAVAPDLFWRFAPGVELNPDLPAEREQAMALLGRFDLDLAVQDVAAAIRWARGEVGGGKVGLVGFCLGGRIAYLAATRTDVDASVGYYGGGIDTMLDERHAIGRPLMLHYGADDGHIPPEAVARVRAALADDPLVTIHDYPGAGHGFAANAGQRRNDAAARTADERTRTLIEHALA